MRGKNYKNMTNFSVYVTARISYSKWS